ncbi:MAG TPA: LysR family transcriptional regulator [Geodermatophilus sp.]|nr:LysR family transcriptional regulator [Geodermatophilus sp.]
MDLDLAQLRALAATVRGGTLETAARELHVTPSAISQRLRALEVATGRILLVRTKPVQVTESGQAVLRLARQVDLLAADVVRELGGDETSAVPTLPIAVNADSTATWVLPALAPLAGEVCFELHREDQEHTSALLRAGTVMAALTTDAEPVPGYLRAQAGLDRPTRAPRARRRGPRLGHHPRSGLGQVPELQTQAVTAGLVALDPTHSVDVVLYRQQWRLHSTALDRVRDVVTAAAKRVLEQSSGSEACDDERER